MSGILFFIFASCEPVRLSKRKDFVCQSTMFTYSGSFCSYHTMMEEMLKACALLIFWSIMKVEKNLQYGMRFKGTTIVNKDLSFFSQRTCSGVLACGLLPAAFKSLTGSGVFCPYEGHCLSLLVLMMLMASLTPCQNQSSPLPKTLTLSQPCHASNLPNVCQLEK